MKALLIVDVQNDYFPGGRCELVGTSEALDNIKYVLEQLRAQKRPIIHVQHINNFAGAPFFLPDTEGVKIHAALTPLGNESIVVKHAPNSFYQTNLLSIVHGLNIGELVVCGMMTHMCIDTTVRAARDFSIPVRLLYDACATKDLSIMDKTLPADLVHDAYMAGLNGIFAQVQYTRDFKLFCESYP